MRVVLRGPLGYRTRLADRGPGQQPELVLDSTIVNATDRFLYQPAVRIALAASNGVRRLQSGRLSIYLLYVMVALILALALVPVLR